MKVAPQIPNQSTRLTGLARAVPVAHACSPLDALVGTHVIDEGHKTVVEYGKVEAEEILGARRDGAFAHGAIVPLSVRRCKQFPQAASVS